jgi:hypothetical protein
MSMVCMEKIKAENVGTPINELKPSFTTVTLREG